MYNDGMGESTVTGAVKQSFSVYILQAIKTCTVYIGGGSVTHSAGSWGGTNSSTFLQKI